jgi:alkylation response protein AidB-like acyl-CoA dehydrogenase
MSQDHQRWISYRASVELARTDASERDQDRSFPDRAFEGLRRLGLVGKPPLQTREMGQLLRVLAAIGRGNLSVGRIYEGHVNAFLLIRWFGTPSQRTQLATSATRGALFGVWNTDLPDEQTTCLTVRGFPRQNKRLATIPVQIKSHLCPEGANCR